EGVQADELTVFRHVNRVAEFRDGLVVLGLGQFLESAALAGTSALQAILESVADGDDANTPGSAKDVKGGAGTSAADADHADSDLVTAGGMEYGRQNSGGRHGGTGGRQEMAT